MFELEITGDDDLPGALAWDPKLGMPVVRRDQPTVYADLFEKRFVLALDESAAASPSPIANAMKIAPRPGTDPSTTERPEM